MLANSIILQPIFSTQRNSEMDPALDYITAASIPGGRTSRLNNFAIASVSTCPCSSSTAFSQVWGLCCLQLSLLPRAGASRIRAAAASAASFGQALVAASWFASDVQAVLNFIKAGFHRSCRDKEMREVCMCACTLTSP